MMKTTISVTLAKSVLLILTLCLLSYRDKKSSKEAIPVYFSEYRITILSIPRLRDTIFYNKSSKENFKIVFFDMKGKCYFERYINKKLYEKGYYENSLDTLKRYVSGRYSSGKTTPIRVEKYFEPLKNGEWIICKNGIIKQNYSMGILKED